MADLPIPPPNADGYWHFTYITTDPIDGRWYGGRRSTKKHPLVDRYLGSGNWVRQHSERHRLKRRIISFYNSSAEVCAVEARMVTWNHVFDDPLCMNLRDGGEGITTEGARILAADPVWRKSVLAASQRIHHSAKARANHGAATRRNFKDAQIRAKHAEGIARRGSNPEWIENHAKAMAKVGKSIERTRKIMAALQVHLANPAYRAKLREALLLRSKNPQWVKKNEESRRKHIYENAEACAKRNNKVRENSKNPDWLAKVAAGVLRRSRNSEWQQNTASANRRKPDDPEWRKKHAVGVKRRSEDPTFREKCRAAAILREKVKRASKEAAVIGQKPYRGSR